MVAVDAEGDMHLTIRGRSLNEVCGELVALVGGLTRVWPSEQPLVTIGDPRILATRFLDAGRVAEPAGRLLIDAAASRPENVRGYGGKKVRSNEVWETPEMRLLSYRALLLTCRATGAEESHVVDRWANVMMAGDYSAPHSHYESDVAVVYTLAAGEQSEAFFREGRLAIIDPRVPFCCPTRPDRPTRDIVPDMTDGTMILFPAEFIHHVPPYRGSTPRITLAWNISVGPPPEGWAGDPSRDRVGAVGVIEM